VHAADAGKLVVRLFSYPAWKVVVNGQPARTGKTDITELMVIPVAAGDNDVQIRFRSTLDRVVGDFVSLISLLVLIVVWIMTRRRSRVGRI
jgi:hypothetical protein